MPAVMAAAAMTPATMAVFVFVHAISFSAPERRVEVELPAAAPFASAAAATDLAKTAGTAWVEPSEIASAIAVVVAAAPLRAKIARNFSNAR